MKGYGYSDDLARVLSAARRRAEVVVRERDNTANYEDWEREVLETAQVIADYAMERALLSVETWEDEG